MLFGLTIPVLRDMSRLSGLRLSTGYMLLLVCEHSTATRARDNEFALVPMCITVIQCMLNAFSEIRRRGLGAIRTVGELAEQIVIIMGHLYHLNEDYSTKGKDIKAPGNNQRKEIW